MRLFKTLKTYRHFINSNSNKKHCLDALEALGLKSITFINLTRLYLKKCFILPSSLPNSIYIGDHEEYDILPAKKLGIKTIIVWKRSPYADYYCRSIYEVGRLLS
jgi:ribonucleotide monophosphatase NagD (HAD superfamily)